MLDTSRNRLFIWGGGTKTTTERKIYSLDLDTLSLNRLTDLSAGFTVGGTCVTTLPDGRPVSRHTYGGLAYIEHAESIPLT